MEFICVVHLRRNLNVQHHFITSKGTRFATDLMPVYLPSELFLATDIWSGSVVHNQLQSVS